MTQPVFSIEPWAITENELSLDRLEQAESVFALSNGHLGLRGNLDEGEPVGLPGTYLNSVYELRPLPYAEAGFGYPESGQTIINVTNGKLIRLLVDDEPLDVRYGTLFEHRRVLDLRAGTLTRTLRWRSPAGRVVRVSSRRLVSLTQRAIAAVEYEVTAEDGPIRMVVQSELVANEAHEVRQNDPRASAALESPLVLEENVVDDVSVMVHRTKRSGLRVGAGMAHEISGPEGTRVDHSGLGDISRVTIAADVPEGGTLRIVKYIAYGWSSQRSRSAVHDQVVAAIAAARLGGWAGLLEDQRSFLDSFWDGADVEVDGDPAIQQAVRFALFHLLQAGARSERRPIPAKGLTGTGYDGHVFWDMEMFVLAALRHTFPSASADALRGRASTLDTARAHAARLGLQGAAFPWRTIDGQECSGYWPAGTAAFHVNADIADAMLRHVDTTGDAEFEGEVALPVLVETARLWRGLGHHDSGGRFRIDGVTGPDEYSALSDNNVYTNLLAQRNLRGAADLVTRLPAEAAKLGADGEEAASWRDAAENMVVPFDERLGVHAQSEGFTEHAVWDFEHTSPDQYPLLLHAPYFDLYRSQVVKQADLVLAMHVCDDCFTDEQKARNFDYYERLTVRDSSLSAATQAVIAAEVGQLDLAHDYLAETALMDLRDINRNTGDGVHLASLAGAWSALVAGFGGMRVGTSDLIRFAPRLPNGLARLAFRVRHRGRSLRVVARRTEATYELVQGDPLMISHHGETHQLGGRPLTLPIPTMIVRPRPTQPLHREPMPRSAHGM
ncbi:MAG: glycoside hydrolase family 65 central catalytic [Acidimicrobiales bacterium]|nr:glycoside hydrolase family 65 central catalytic [Acidimicrobiales bacterium]